MEDALRQLGAVIARLTLEIFDGCKNDYQAQVSSGSLWALENIPMGKAIPPEENCSAIISHMDIAFNTSLTAIKARRLKLVD